MERGDVRERGALLCVGAVVGIGLLLTAPGRIVPETKLDVLLDPVGMAARALGAWDPSAGFGQVQNQAIGYLFPMGAWSALGKVAGLPPWIVQRLWLWGIVVLSLWGAHRVARAIGIATAGGRVVAATAYALAPATVTITFFQSAGQLPYALVPHVLAELMAPRPGSTPRRTAARSALWLAAMGGVNGASAVAVLPLVGIWFWTRSPGATRRRLLGWWSLGAVLATLWWAIPLLVTVRYGLRFTDYTETAATTTISESATEILRGTGNWLSYVSGGGESWLPGSWALVSSPLAIVATVALAAGGLAGLARRRAPERVWAIACVLVGATAMGIGWAGAGGGPFASAAQHLLDGALAPLRNVHKFAAVVRLPLVLGLGHAVDVGVAWVRARKPERARVRPWAVPAFALGTVVLAIVPAVGAGVTAPGSFEDVPVAWRQAAAWLEHHDDGGRTLLLPGSSFGEYRWGRPLDEPISSIGGTDWAVRNLVPLGGNGSTRLLDGIDAALATDSLPDGFVPTLRRAGVSYLLVRNDLDLELTGGPSPATMRRLLRDVDGVRLAASFGPPVTTTGGDGRATPLPGDGPGGSASEAIREIDVYALARAQPRVAAYPAADAIVLGGGPEGLLAAPGELTDGRAVVLAVDDPGTLDRTVRVATDSARRRDVEFNAIRDASTATLTAGEASPRTGDAPKDRWPGDAPVGLSVADLDGAATLADHGGEGQLVPPEVQPFAAFDDDPDTAWEPQGDGVGQWLQVTFVRARRVGDIEIDLPRAEGRRIRAVDVVTDGATAHATFDARGTATIEAPARSTRTVRIRVTDVVGHPDLGAPGIAEVRIGGVDLSRPIVAAAAGTPSGGEPQQVGADALVLSRDRRDRLDRTRRDEDGRFDRLVRWAGGEATISGTATVGDGARLDALLAATEPDDATLRATASSRYRDAPSSDTAWAIDGNSATAWVSDREAGAPSLAIAWDGPVLVDSLTLDVVDEGTPVGSVEVDAAGTSTTARLDASGRVELAEPVTTDRLTLRFPDAAKGGTVGIAEVEVPALAGRTAAVPDRRATVRLACGDGPEITVDGTEVPTRAAATVAELADAGSVRWQACEPTSMTAGRHRIEAGRGALFASSIVVERTGLTSPPGSASARKVASTRWGTQHRSVALSGGAATILATTENSNAGWEATFDGRRLEPIRVDGWRQGWVVPAGAAGTVELRFRPATTQRVGFALGLAGLLALVALALVGRRHRRAAEDASAPTPAAVAARPFDHRVRGVLVAGCVAAGLALAGAGVLLLVPIVALRPVARRRWLVASLAAVAAGAIALTAAGAGPGSAAGTFSPVAQWLSTAAVLAVGASVAWGRDQPGSTEPTSG